MASILSGGNLGPLSTATAEDRAQSQEFFRQLALLQQNYQQALQQQRNLGRNYDAVINGTAPSVAGTQLQRTTGEIDNALRANAAGAGGNNAALANYGAIQAMAQARAKANADAAVLRAKEVSDARTGKAGLLNQEQGATSAFFSPTIGAGTTLSGQATQGAGQYGQLDTEEAAARRNFISNLVQAGGSAIASMAA